MSVRALTKEDWEAAARYRDECRQIAMCTDPMDLPKAKENISKLYAKMGWTVKNWHTFASPNAAKEWILAHKGNDYLNTNFYGNQEMYWIAFLRFGQDHMGIDYGEEKRELLDIWYNIACACSWWFVIDEETCLICDRPCKVNVDESARLHDTGGYAIEFRDGFGVCVYNGMFIPEDREWFLFHPEQLDVDKINAETNPDIRRAMVEVMGTDRYLNAMEMELVAADFVPILSDPNAPMMPRFLMKAKKTDAQYLVGTDGSTERVYFMEVDPESTTCEEAHNSISPVKESRIIASS